MSGLQANAAVFADALDGSATGLVEDTEMLLVIVDRLHELPGSTSLAGAGANLDFRADLRARLVEEAGREHDGTGRGKVVPITSRWNQSWGRRNRLRIVSGIAAGIVGLTAISIGAANSLPGNPLYQLKRGGESAQYALAGSDEARGKLELGFARTRLHEIDRLTQHDAAYGILPTNAPQAAGGSSVLAASVATKVVRLFADMDSEAAKGSRLLAQSYAKDPRPGPLLAVQQFAKDQQKSLTTLRGRLSEPALSKATRSLAWANQVVKSTTAALAKCSGATCPPATLAQFGGSIVPSLAPSMPASSGPSLGAPASQTSLVPSGAPSTVPGSSAAVPTLPVTSPQPTTGQPTVGQPTDTPPTTDQPTSPTDSPTTDQPTDSPTTDAPPSVGPTSTQPPTTSSEPSPTTSTTDTSPPPSTPVVETTTPPPSTVPPTTPVPSITPVPTTAPPATSAAALPTDPATTTSAWPIRGGRPRLICLPPSVVRNGHCVPGPHPPGVGAAAS
ncbi:MAG: hypothetical protein QOI76_2652 [Frankiales bacterium]|nr:hypothetical protein [Frankiales bacterium]